MIRTVKNFIKLCIQILFGNKFLIYRMPCQKDCVALTFDDGPHPVHTPAILDILRMNGVKATFFMVGNVVEKYPGLARQILAEGHCVAMHSYSHINFEKSSMEDIKKEILQTRRLFNDVLGVSSFYIRPPGGRLSLRGLFFCVKHSIKTIMWNVDGYDFEFKGNKPLQDQFNNRRFSNGDIVLLHDDRMSTVEGLQGLIDRIKKDGLGFTTIGDR